MKTTPIQLADQLIEYLEGGINPLECWPLLEQLDAELVRLLGPPGQFPNCHPRLLARKLTDSVPTLWLLDFSVPDVDHAHQFRGTRAELVGDELAELTRQLLVAIRGWRRKLDGKSEPVGGHQTDTKKKNREITKEAWDAYQYWKQQVALGFECTYDQALDHAIGANNRENRHSLKKQMTLCRKGQGPLRRRTPRGH